MQVLVSLCLWAPSKYKIQQGKLNFVKKSQKYHVFGLKILLTGLYRYSNFSQLFEK